MAKVKIQIIKLGGLKHKIHDDIIQKWKSEFFEVAGIFELPALDNPYIAPK